MTESERIGNELDRQANRDRQELPAVGSWPVSQRRTAAEINAEWVRRTVVCDYCGLREVPEDNECSRCGVIRK